MEKCCVVSEVRPEADSTFDDLKRRVVCVGLYVVESRADLLKYAEKLIGKLTD